ncbi:hypothetical protein KAI58_00010 [Candidatus Gracilibacteria bacterium]|nr:hypothetical protein [Candidatus Gracilibacteria bacterium]
MTEIFSLDYKANVNRGFSFVEDSLEGCEMIVQTPEGVVIITGFSLPDVHEKAKILFEEEPETWKMLNEDSVFSKLNDSFVQKGDVVFDEIVTSKSKQVTEIISD